jgi:hypothetical protein
MKAFPALTALLVLGLLTPQAQTPLTITTEPNAIVWIDEIRRGTTDASGKLVITKSLAAIRCECGLLVLKRQSHYCFPAAVHSV